MPCKTRHTGGGSVKVIGRRHCYIEALHIIRERVCVCVGRRDSARVHVLRGGGG